ncbi:WD40 repeat domain-containing protein [Thiococcus pfennigii]|uniref:WD40 repeat domain-containing protein n=1 Tax=Thiococcus pfennigii TaxID=1057 RepID=UPI0019089265|nr:WD40 repeat domain-containing protein [Thiococcus pfennigii]MBK1730661.1 hypothetical protein [Thiococcus pfennigii]
MTDTRVRIFVSSPSDVDHERALVRDIIEQLAQEYLPYFALEPILWEQEALTADRTFQAGLLRPADCDIVLVVLWTRLGTPLPEDPYQGMTGTEWEFVSAVEASDRRGRPEVLVFKKTSPRLVDITNPQATQAALEDRLRLEAFFARHFFNEDRTFRRAFRTFASDAAFRELVETQLRRLLNRRIGVERRGTGRPAWRGSPFRAGAPFEVADERIFTGRERETRDLVHRIAAGAGGGRRLLVVTGPSGCGKTSLLRAGLLAALARPFLIEGVAGCRWCLLEPVAGRSPLTALAAGLAAQDCLGAALAELGVGAADLVRLLAADPTTAARQVAAALVRQARLRALESGGSGDRLLLAILADPLEGLIEAGTGGAAARALAALAEREDVWVLAGLRSDRLPRLAEFAPLAERLDAAAIYRLGPPPAGRIRQVIQIPARVAGLDYEGDEPGAGRGVVDLLEAEAGRLEHWPPLLQLALERLYVARGEDGRPADGPLSLAAYRAAGGLLGVTIARADAVWAGLDEAARATLPRLCRGLISLEGAAEQRPTRRTGDLATLAADPACARLLAALIEARLVAADGQADPGDGGGACPPADYSLGAYLRQILRDGRVGWGRRPAARPVTEVAVVARANAVAGEDEADAPHWERLRATATFTHPRLLADWGPVRDWLAQPANRRVLQLRAQLTRQALLWRRTDYNREYLLGEAGYALARPLFEDMRPELEPIEAELLDHSARHLRFKRRRNWAFRGLAVTLFALLVVATGAALRAWEANRVATLNLQRSLLNEADLAIGQGNTPRAVRLALDAGPYLPDAALDTLSRAFTAKRLIAMAPAGDGPPAFSADGTRLATLLPRGLPSGGGGGGVQLWRLADDRFVPAEVLATPAAPLHQVRLAGPASAPGEGAVLVGLGEGGLWRLPAAADAAPDYPCPSTAASLTAVDPSGRFLAVTHGADGGQVCLVDLATPGRVVFDRPVHEQEIRSLVFAPDGDALLTASRDGRARLLARADGRELLALPGDGPLGRPINRAVFDAAGERIALACADDRTRVYRRDGTRLTELAEIRRDGRTIALHKSGVRDVAFAPDGRFLVAVDDDGQVVRWDLARTASADVLGHHGLSADLVRIVAPPGREPLVLTASLDKTARLWGLDTGREQAVYSHNAAVSGAAFSTDGRRVMTYSAAGGTARLWGVAPLSRLAYRLAHEDHVWSVAVADAPAALAPHGEALLVASAAFDGTVGVWRYDRRGDGAPPQRVVALAGHTERVRRAQFAPDGRRLATAAFDGTARVWDLVDGRTCVLEVGAGAAKPWVHQAQFGPGGDWLVTASGDPERPLRLWDPAACRALAPEVFAAAHGAPVQALAIGADGQGGALVAAGDDAGRVRVWRRAGDGTWSSLCGLAPHRAPVLDLALAPDGGLLASASEGGRAALVRIAADGCEPLASLEGHEGTVYSVGFAPNGERLVTASLDGTARLWRRDGTRVATLAGHQDRIYRAAFSPDGAWLLTASRDGQVRLWRNPPGGREAPESSFLVLGAALGGVADAVFSPDGRYIAAAYWENAALLWRVWGEAHGGAPGLAATWGEERARLVLLREAVRFRAANRFDEEVAALPQ